MLILQVSIDESAVCDFIINCDHAEDEMNCGNDGRFYCMQGEPLFVKSQKVCHFFHLRKKLFQKHTLS